MNVMTLPFLDDVDLLMFAGEQTNAALRVESDVGRATIALRRAGLPCHPDGPKNWDGFLAIFHALANCDPDGAVLDAGAERYSAFLPTLRELGFTNLTGINLTFTAPIRDNGVTLLPGDITVAPFPDQSFNYIACLSVIEHGVDVAAFLREQARLLKPGGHLFVSFDYWEDAIETNGQTAYGVPIRIFTRDDAQVMIAQAAELGLRMHGTAELGCVDRVVHWQRFGLRYSFANLLFERE
jgi:SAM-dependent methyltransferase